MLMLISVLTSIFGAVTYGKMPAVISPEKNLNRRLSSQLNLQMMMVPVRVPLMLGVLVGNFCVCLLKPLMNTLAFSRENWMKEYCFQMHQVKQMCYIHPSVVLLMH